MYNHLRGRLFEKHLGDVVIDVAGVGYKIKITEKTYQELPAVDSECLIYLKQVVRENEISLYGFSSTEERSLFLNLIKVSKVGPSIAQQILSQVSIDRLTQAIVGGDVDYLKNLKGLGKKTSEKIIVELRDSLKVTPGSFKLNESSTYPEDAYLALLTLGFSPEKAKEKLSKLSNAETPPTEINDWIRLALKI